MALFFHCFHFPNSPYSGVKWHFFSRRKIKVRGITEQKRILYSLLISGLGGLYKTRNLLNCSIAGRCCLFNHKKHRGEKLFCSEGIKRQLKVDLRRNAALLWSPPIAFEVGESSSPGSKYVVTHSLLQDRHREHNSTTTLSPSLNLGCVYT